MTNSGFYTNYSNSLSRSSAFRRLCLVFVNGHGDLITCSASFIICFLFLLINTFIKFNKYIYKYILCIIFNVAQSSTVSTTIQKLFRKNELNGS